MVKVMLMIVELGRMISRRVVSHSPHYITIIQIETGWLFVLQI